MWNNCGRRSRIRAAAGSGHCLTDRILLLVLAYRTNLTMQQLGSLFGISDSAVHRVVDRLAGPLAELLGPPPTDRSELWIVDGTLIPVHDKRKTAKSKNYRQCKHPGRMPGPRPQDRRVGDAWPGNRNDSVVFRDTVGRTLPDHRTLSGDGGYRGSDRIRTPHRGANGRLIKDILRQCRRRGDGINHAVAGVAALHNLKLDAG